MHNPSGFSLESVTVPVSYEYAQKPNLKITVKGHLQAKSDIFCSIDFLNLNISERTEAFKAANPGKSHLNPDNFKFW